MCVRLGRKNANLDQDSNLDWLDLVGNQKIPILKEAKGTLP